MRKMDGWFVLSQPKYRIPSVFDLHERGTFSEKPAVTKEFGGRILVDDDLQLALEYRYLIEDRGVRQGRMISHVTQQGLVLLDDACGLDLTKVHQEVVSSEAIEEIGRVYRTWCKDFLPMAADGTLDRAALDNKLCAALNEGRKQLREELRRTHGGWIDRGVAALSGGINGWNRGATLEETYRHYHELGGGDRASGVYRKVAQFYTICESDLFRPDNETWQNEEEIWECWLAFAGGEEEAWRVMDALRGAIGEMR